MTSRSFLIPRHLCQTPDLALICIALYYRRVSVVFAKSHTPAIPLPQQQGPVLPPTCAISPPAVATPPARRARPCPLWGNTPPCAGTRLNPDGNRPPAWMEKGRPMACRCVAGAAGVPWSWRRARSSWPRGRTAPPRAWAGLPFTTPTAAPSLPQALQPWQTGGHRAPEPASYAPAPACSPTTLPAPAAATGERPQAPAAAVSARQTGPPASLQPAYPQIVTRRTASHRRPVTPPRRCSPSPARRWRPRWPDAGPLGPDRRRGSGAPPAGGGACR